MDITNMITGGVIGFLFYFVICIIAIIVTDHSKWDWDDFISFLLCTIAGSFIGYLTISTKVCFN